MIDSEARLQTACNRALDKAGIKYFHYERGRKINHAHRAGLPDLVIWHRGNTYFVELKWESGFLSQEQRDFRDWAFANSFRYMTCWTFDEFVATLREWSIIK